MGNGNLLTRLKNWRLLPPRDREFYALFEETTKTVVEGSVVLSELFTSEGSLRAERATRIETLLSRCGQITEQISQLVQHSQQPPFDRGEITEFAVKATRILRFINHAANRFVIYDMPSSDSEMRELSVLIREACDQLNRAVLTLAHDRKLDAYCRAIELLEGKADEVYHGGLRRRFQEIRGDSRDLMTRIDELNEPATADMLLPLIAANVQYTRHVAVFFILRQVYAELERAIDACTDLGATVKRMVSSNV